MIYEYKVLYLYSWHLDGMGGFTQSMISYIHMVNMQRRNYLVLDSRKGTPPGYDVKKIIHATPKYVRSNRTLHKMRWTRSKLSSMLLSR